MKIRKVRIRTKNFTAKGLRNEIFCPGHAVVRLGSTTKTESIFPTIYGRYPVIEINSVSAVQNSRDKLKMKKCFDNLKVRQAIWYENLTNPKKLELPIIVKLRTGFKGHGMRLINTHEELTSFIKSHNMSDYIVEHFYNYAREYRLHCTQDNCFMAWRKLRKEGAKERWFFNSSNCNWVNPNHEMFNKPLNWDIIEKECIKAMRATGLDLGAVDVRVQSEGKKNPDFIICEVNSAPALGDRGVEVYKKVIKELIHKKI